MDEQEDKNNSEVQEAEPEERRLGFPVSVWLTLVLLNLTVIAGIGYIYWQQLDQKRYVEGAFVELDKSLHQLETTLAAIDTKKIVSALNVQSKNSSDLRKRFTEDTKDLGDSLEGLKEVRASLGLMLRDGNKAAQKSNELAKQYWDSGDPDTALVFLLNAINREPDNVEFLTRYVQWVNQSDDVGTRQGAIAMLQESLYTVDSENVRTVMGLLEKVIVVPADPDGAEEQPTDQWFTEQLDLLAKQPISEIADKPEELGSRMALLGGLLSEMKMAEVAPASKEIVEKLLRETNACLAATEVMEIISMRSGNVEEAYANLVIAQTPSAETGVLAALTAAEIAVNQVWDIPLGLLPAKTKDKLLRAPSDFKTQAAKIQGLVEDRQFATAKKIWETGKGMNEGTYEQRIQARQDALQKSMEILEGFKTDNGKDKARQMIQEMSKATGELKQQQYAQYQRWALATLEKARKTYNAPTISQDKDARNAIFKTDFLEINRAILSPEVGQFFQGVFSQILAEVGPDIVAEFQREMAFPKTKTKRKLEDF